MNYFMEKIVVLLILSVGLVLGSCSDGGDEGVASGEAEFGIADVGELLPPISGGKPNITYAYDNTIAAQLGGGYNPISDSITGVTCVQEVDRMVEGGAVTSHSSFEYVDNTKELMQKLKISAAASMGLGMFKGSTSGDIVENINVSTHTVAAIAKYEVKGKYRTFSNAILNPNFLENGLTVDKIYEACGNYFLSSVTSGASLVAIIQIQCDSISQKQSIKSELNAEYGVYDGESSFTGEFSKKLSKYKAKVDVYATGCLAIEPATSFDEYLALMKTFAKETNACMDDPDKGVMQMTSTATFLKLDSILSAAGVRVKDIKEQTEAMDKLFEFRMDYINLDSDIDHVLDNNYLYEYDNWDDTEAKLEAAKTTIATYIESIEDKIDFCMNSTIACGFLDENELPPADYPGPLRNAVIPPINNFHPKSCKELPQSSAVKDGRHTLYFRGDESKPFTAYCKDMNIDGTEPKTYLEVSSDNNYAEFKNYWHWKANNKSEYWPNMTTSYEKVRLNDEGQADHLYIYDDTFAITDCQPNDKYHSDQCKSLGLGNWMGGPGNDLLYAPYGCIIGSRRGPRLPETTFTATTMIDLTGTPFALGNHQHWHFEGTSVDSEAQIGKDRKTAKIQVGGDNGYGRPDSTKIELKWVGY